MSGSNFVQLTHRLSRFVTGDNTRLLHVTSDRLLIPSLLRLMERLLSLSRGKAHLLALTAPYDEPAAWWPSLGLAFREMGLPHLELGGVPALARALSLLESRPPRHMLTVVAPTTIEHPGRFASDVSALLAHPYSAALRFVFLHDQHSDSGDRSRGKAERLELLDDDGFARTRIDDLVMQLSPRTPR